MDFLKFASLHNQVFTRDKLYFSINRFESTHPWAPGSHYLWIHTALLPSFTVYINELAKEIESSPSPWPKLQDTQIKCLFCADDLLLPTKEGLQNHLLQLEKYCQTWDLSINQSKTKVLTFQKTFKLQRNNCNFKIGNKLIEETNLYMYLGLNISNTGSFSLAVNELKAKRAFYAIKRSINIELPIRTWLNIFKSVIEPITIYGSEVWDTQTQQDWTQWDKHPIEIMHAEFC